MLSCDILIKNASVLMPDMSIAKNQTIAIYGSRILEIADTDNSDQTISGQAETVIDDPHLLWMPGLTDGHLHTSQQFLRGSLLDEKPVIWKRINVPFEASLTEETMALSARLSGAEMIKSGTTSFVDAGGPHIEAAAEECRMVCASTPGRRCRVWRDSTGNTTGKAASSRCTIP